MGAPLPARQEVPPSENQRPLRIHLVLEVRVPEGPPLVHALTLAVWRFPGVAGTTLFPAVLQAIEARTRTELAPRFPGRVRHTGHHPRQWQLPFGPGRLGLGTLRDRLAHRTVSPRKEALALPGHVRWCEAALAPGTGGR